ncbi:MAG TPA: hypothetical protein PLK31_01455, partial [Chloroflexota bacterium]|nr:hypothetical protein [Chloroflexota bacterium]
MIATNYFSTARIAGILLLLGLLILLYGVGSIAAQGRLEGMAAGYRGVSFSTRDASGLRTIARFAVPYLMAQLAGFALLKAGDKGTAVVALVLFVFGTVLAVIEVSFHASVTVWAVRVARAGAAPEFYEPLRHWINYGLQRIYISFLLTALLLFSWLGLHAKLLPSWLGW